MFAIRQATLPLKFYVAYALRAEAGREPDPRRPVTFVFNGGPGAASAYLNLGALGPRVMATAADGGFLPPPQRLLDNPSTWLDMTDLVFVDPVGTGYSREAPGHEAHEFWGVNQDAASVGAFIRLYLAQTGRTGSPVFLAGESYGGFRAALLARTLQEDIGISPSGIVLISPALEFTLVRPDEFQPLHWARTPVHGGGALAEASRAPRFRAAGRGQLRRSVISSLAAGSRKDA